MAFVMALTQVVGSSCSAIAGVFEQVEVQHCCFLLAHMQIGSVQPLLQQCGGRYSTDRLIQLFSVRLLVLGVHNEAFG